MEYAILKISDISKTYHIGNNKIRALNNVSFEVNSGEVVAIMGSSGSGKSTLLNVIGAMDKPDSGNIYLDGKWQQDIFNEPEATEYRSNNIGFIFQAYNLLSDLNVEENIALPLVLKNEKQSDIDSKVYEYMVMTGIERYRHHMPAEISGGQQQRVAIARALIGNPRILLADEPTGNLDLEKTEEILNIMLNLRKKLNQTIILVTHDVKVASYADRILFFSDGKVVEQHKNSSKEGNLDEIIDIFKCLCSGKNSYRGNR